MYIDLSNVCAKSYFLYNFSNIDCCSVLYKFNRVYGRSRMYLNSCKKVCPSSHYFGIFEKSWQTCSYMTAILKIKAKKIKNIFEDAPRYYTVSCNIPK